MKQKLSVVIISKNEEKHIEEAIKSALFADEIIVLDSYSTDRTCQIAEALGANVFKQKWLGFGPQKNMALGYASNTWVFVLDCDERITPELRQEIEQTLQDPHADGYHIARLNNFFGKEMKHCGLYPDYNIRLFNKNRGKFNNALVHESVQLSGKVSKLKNHMIHLPYENIFEFIEKQNMYSSLNHKKRNLFKAIVNSYWRFFKLFIIKKGFLDGWHGFIISKLYAQYTFWKYIK